MREKHQQQQQTPSTYYEPTMICCALVCCYCNNHAHRCCCCSCACFVIKIEAVHLLALFDCLKQHTDIYTKTTSPWTQLTIATMLWIKNNSFIRLRTLYTRFAVCQYKLPHIHWSKLHMWLHTNTQTISTLLRFRNGKCCIWQKLEINNKSHARKREKSNNRLALNGYLPRFYLPNICFWFN